MKRIFHSLLVVLLCAIVAAAWQPAYGQSYPTKPIRMILPYPPGGGPLLIQQHLGFSFLREIFRGPALPDP